MNRYSKYQTSRRCQNGFSLVELMIAMVLSLILLSGVIQIFASTRTSYRAHEAVSQLQENGRIASEILSRDIRMADFWGCIKTISQLTNNLTSAGTDFIDFKNGGIAGADGGAGSDTLTLRGGFGARQTIQSPYGPQTSSDLLVSVNNDIETSDMIVVSDCETADIVQVTNADPNGTGELAHITGSGAPGNSNIANPGCSGGGSAQCLSKIYGGNASVFKVQQITYTIGNGAAGQPALFRNGQELVDGIEDFQVLYGEDTDSSGYVNRYVSFGDVSDMANVISIRYALVVRSYSDNITTSPQSYTVLGTNTDATDNRLRQVFTATTSIRNRLR